MAWRGTKGTSALWEALGLLGLLTTGACFDSKPPASGNSNWLSPCDTNDDCADGTSCECGVCAITCDATSDCSEAGEGAVCGVAAAWGSQCESQSAADARVCTVECDSDDVCESALGEGFLCVGTACLSSDGFMSRAGTGGDVGPTGGATGGDVGPTGGMTGGMEPATGGDVGPTGGATGGTTDPVTGGAIIDPEPDPVDGDGECESGETPETAPRDCEVAGDGLCTGHENAVGVPGDCLYTRVTVNPDGSPVEATDLAVTGDGRYAIYSNLGTVYVHDLEMRVASVLLTEQGLGPIHTGVRAASGDGRFALIDISGPIERSDTNAAQDVYLVDLESAETHRVSLDETGAEMAVGCTGVDFSHGSALVYYECDGVIFEYAIESQERRTVEQGPLRKATSEDGSVKAWSTKIARLPGDVNDTRDIYALELGKQVERVSISEEGFGANLSSASPAVSSDGRLVAFSSRSTNLTLDSAGRWDIFVKDRISGRVKRVTTTTEWSGFYTRSRDGQHILFDDPVFLRGDRYLTYGVYARLGDVRVRGGMVHYIGDWVDSLPEP